MAPTHRSFHFHRFLLASLTAAAMAATAVGIGAQGLADPRVGLKPGLRDAGTAARNMELLANLPKPDG